MKPEKQQLIHAVLDGDPRREATLAAATKILRHRRHWHAAGRALAVITLATTATLLVQPSRQPQPAPPISQPHARPVAPLPVQALTDDELLALFPNTPVGLATLPNGRKLLIFPHPGDEARFITHL